MCYIRSYANTTYSVRKLMLGEGESECERQWLWRLKARRYERTNERSFPLPFELGYDLLPAAK